MPATKKRAAAKKPAPKKTIAKAKGESADKPAYTAPLAAMKPANKAAVAASVAVMKQSCCKHSKYKVGSCLVSDSGALFTGINVESDSYGLTCCAERVALFKALSEGVKRFRFLVCSTAGGGTCCGACRQLLCEYCPASMPVVRHAPALPRHSVSFPFIRG